MKGQRSDNTIDNQTTPELQVSQWVDKHGNATDPVSLSDFEGKFKVLFCFQSWCHGCHSKGFPDLRMMVEALKGNDQVVFLAIQTVFEGFHANTYEKMIETQKQYDLNIPFGHDAGEDGKSVSQVMINYGTGGTPWFILIDQDDQVVFADFHLDVEKAIDFLILITIDNEN